MESAGIVDRRAKRAVPPMEKESDIVDVETLRFVNHKNIDFISTRGNPEDGVQLVNISMASGNSVRVLLDAREINNLVGNANSV